MDKTTFQEYINQQEIADLWGEARLTELEFGILCDLYKKFHSWEKIKTLIEYGGDYLWKYLQSLDDEKIEQYFHMSAIAHGCPVAVQLYDNPDRSKIETIWSYLTKNRFYRGVKKAIKESQNTWLLEEWTTEEVKAQDEIGRKDAELVRPQMSDRQFPLQGVEKVQVYWIVQTLRILDALVSGVGKPVVTIGNLEGQNLVGLGKFLDEIMLRVVQRSNNLENLTLNSFLETVWRLRNQIGLDNDRIASIMIKGFDPIGPLGENGQYSKIKAFWEKIISRLQSNGFDDEILGNILEAKINEILPN